MLSKVKEEVPSGAVKQTLLQPMIQKTAAQHLQLGRKFQLAHYSCPNCNLFKSYENF